MDMKHTATDRRDTDNGENIAKHGVATQKSSKEYGEAWRAIDGNTDGAWKDDIT